MNKLFSRYYYDKDNVEQLTKNSLPDIAMKADKVTIVSAYYSASFFIDFFSQLPKRGRKKCEIVLVVNGFAGHRFETQKTELKGLEDKLTDLGYINIKIYLNVESSLFHSKLYCFHDATGTHWFIGSANASEAAFSQNEEILFHFTNENIAFEIYIDKIIEGSIDYRSTEKLNINNLIKFWRTGLIYYKPITVIQFSFSRLKIPNWVKSQLSQIQTPPPYANSGEPWGPFNLRLALGFEDEDEGIIQARHNSLSIETCFGYWVPSFYKERLDQKISEVSKKKEKELLAIKDKMEELGNNYLVKKIEEYLSGVKGKLNDLYVEFDWKKNDRIVVRFDHDECYIGTVLKSGHNNLYVEFDDGDNKNLKKSDVCIAGVGVKRKRKKEITEKELSKWLEKEFWRPSEEKILTQYEKFIEGLFRKLRDGRHVNRASSPLISSTMPEIWNDSVAVNEFSESFFEYVSYRLNLPKKPLVIKSLRNNCKLDENDIWEDVKKKIETYVENKGWSDDNWLKK